MTKTEQRPLKPLLKAPGLYLGLFSLIQCENMNSHSPVLGSHILSARHTTNIDDDSKDPVDGQPSQSCPCEAANNLHKSYNGNNLDE